MKALFSEWGLFLVYVIVGAFAFYIFSRYTMTYQSSSAIDGEHHVYVSVMEGMIAKISGSSAEEVIQAKEFIHDNGWELVK